MQSKSFLVRSIVIALVVHILIWLGVFVDLNNWWPQHSPYKEPKIIIRLKNLDTSYLSSITPQSISTPATKNTKSTIKNRDNKENKADPISPVNPLVQEEAILLEPSERVEALIQRHYGELFEDLSHAEKVYIVNNIVAIHRIDRQVGNALLAEKAPNDFQNGDSNFVEMYLYPGGTVSDITLINQKENGALDELTMETVQMSYAKYPRPQQKTLIRLHTRIMRVKNTY
jgi:hypothetical protein